MVTGSRRRRKAKKARHKPKRLMEGDTVGVIAPASNTWENEDIRLSLELVESLGFRPKPGAHLFDRKGYLAGKDEDRVRDLNQMFADPEVKAIFCLRGGYGTPRILPLVDYDNIRRNPKILLGYSDITALLNSIHHHTGLVTFHGPMPSSNFSAYTLEGFRKILMNPESPLTIGQTPPFEVEAGQVDRVNRLVRIVPGKARGLLVGGNLSLLVKMLGTPYEPDFKDKILVLEDVGEKPYRLDGMLTHLWLAGKLTELAGVVLGKFTNCEADSPGSLSLETMFEERFKALGIPTLRGLMIGHVRDNATFPIGVEAELDVDAGTLTLLDTGVA